MFRFNEETYGVKSTYDSSLAMYTYVDVLSALDLLFFSMTFKVGCGKAFCASNRIPTLSFLKFQFDNFSS